MLEKGPIPRFLQGVLEYLIGILFVVSPFVFDLAGGAVVTAVCVISGVIVIVLAACSAGSTGLVDQVPHSVHALFDFILGALWIASPFIFGFSDVGAASAEFVAAGIFWILVTIGTRYRRPVIDQQPVSAEQSHEQPVSAEQSAEPPAEDELPSAWTDDVGDESDPN